MINIEHVGVQGPERDRHPLFGRDRDVFFDDRQKHTQDVALGAVRWWRGGGRLRVATLSPSVVSLIKDRRQIVPREPVLGEQHIELVARDLTVLSGRAHLRMQLPYSTANTRRRQRHGAHPL